MKHLCIHITQHIQDFYAENYKTLMKEIKDDLNILDWKDPVKLSFPLKSIYTLI